MANFALGEDNCELLDLDDLCGGAYFSGGGLKLLNMNVRSVEKNIGGLENMLASCSANIDIVCLTETWLKCDKFCKQLMNYVRIDNSVGINKSSGVMMFLSNRVRFRRISAFEMLCCDSLFIEVQDPSRVPIIIGVIYRSNAVDLNVFLSEWERLLTGFFDSGREVILVGDFNVDVGIFNSDSDNFLGIANNYGFRQSVSEVTRPSVAGGSILDLCFVNGNVDVSAFVVKDLITDHSPVFTVFQGYLNQLKGNQAGRYVVEHVNWNLFREYMKSVNLNRIRDVSDIDDGVQLLTSVIQEGIGACTVSEIRNRRFFCPKKPWMTVGILRCIRKRCKLKYRLSRNGCAQGARDRYKRYRNVLRSVIDNARRRYFEKELINMKNSSKAVWDKVNDFIKGRASDLNRAPEEIVLNDVSYTDPVDVANCFNDYFLNVNEGHTLDNTKEYLNYLGNVPYSLFWSPVTKEEVFKIVRGLNKTSKGVDGISGKALQEAFPFIVNYLVNLSNLMLQSGVFPSGFKNARVRVFFKKGCKKDPYNYRAISILPSLSKVFESVINIRMVSYLEGKELLCKEQFGFRHCRSAEDAVAEVASKIGRDFDNGDYVAMVNLDVRKAFDSLSHDILLQKLNVLGVRGLPLQLLASYLKGRMQFVEFSDGRSAVGPVLFGVPQGSILGPVLFLVYINDIVNSSGLGEFILFADDNNICIHNKVLSVLMTDVQVVVNRVLLWYSRNRLFLNVKKCTFMILCSPYRRSHFNMLFNTFVLCINDVVLLPVLKVTYLGVLFDMHLSWKNHVFEVCNRICRLLPIFYKLRVCFSKRVLMSVYFALCQSVVAYGILIYGSTHKTKLKRISSLQRRVIRVIHFIYKFGNVDLIMKSGRILNVYELNIKAIMLLYHSLLYGRSAIGCRFKRTQVVHNYDLRTETDDWIVARFTNSYGRFHLSVRVPIVANFFKRYVGFRCLGEFVPKKTVKIIIIECIFKVQERLLDLF